MREGAIELVLRPTLRAVPGDFSEQALRSMRGVKGRRIVARQEASLQLS